MLQEKSYSQMTRKFDKNSLEGMLLCICPDEHLIIDKPYV